MSHKCNSPEDLRDAEDFATSGALLSECGSYRYRLWRAWGDSFKGCATFVMLNPSTADAQVDDPTIRKCRGFAQRWGYDGLVVVNLFAWRSTEPRGLLASDDPVGPDNDEHFECLPHRVVCAWGASGSGALRKLIEARAAKVTRMLAPERELWCLGRSKDGHPRHPLMLAYDTPLEQFGGPA